MTDHQNKMLLRGIIPSKLPAAVDVWIYQWSHILPYHSVNRKWVLNTQKKCCLLMAHFFLYMCVFNPPGRVARGVMARKITPVWPFNRQRASWVAWWHVGTRHGTLPSPGLIAVHASPSCWAESELFWFDCTQCYLIGGWVSVSTFNDHCLIIISHQGTFGGAGWRYVGMFLQ